MFENKTLENLKHEMLDNINLPLAKNEGSFLNELVTGLAVGNLSVYTVLEEIYKRAFIDLLFGEYLDVRLKEFGYTRKPGTRTTAYITVYGVEGTIIPHDTVFTYLDKRFNILESEQPYVIKGGVVSILVAAEEEGSSYNLLQSIELECDLLSVSRVTNFVIKTLGYDEESDDDFRERFYYAQSHKGSSGNVDDYINWALEVPGVKTARCVPLHAGNGTVKVIISGDNNSNLSSEIVAATKAHIESKRPIGATITVSTPTKKSINVSATVELLNGYSVEVVKDIFTSLLDDYISTASGEITYTKVGSILSRVDGVIDYSNLQLNSSNRNIKISDTEIGGIGDINLTSGVID